MIMDMIMIMIRISYSFLRELNICKLVSLLYFICKNNILNYNNNTNIYIYMNY